MSTNTKRRLQTRMFGVDTMIPVSWTLLNLFSLIMLFISIGYTGWLWHCLRKQRFDKNLIADKVALLIQQGKTRKQTIKELDFYNSDIVKEKYDELKNLF